MSRLSISRLLLILGFLGFGVGVVWGWHLDSSTLTTVAHILGERDVPSSAVSPSPLWRTTVFLLGETFLLAWIGASVILIPILGLYYAAYAARLGFTLAFLYRVGFLRTTNTLALLGLHGLSLVALAIGLMFTARFSLFLVNNRLLRYRDPLRPELVRYVLAWLGVFVFRVFLWWMIPTVFLPSSALSSLAAPLGFAV